MSKAAIFVLFVLTVCGMLAAVIAAYTVRARRLRQTSWSTLMDRLLPVDREALRTVALDLMDENGVPWGEGDSTLDDDSVWRLLGGLEGLERLQANCGVLIDLAAYVQTWHPEAISVAAQLRLHASEIQWHVNRLKVAQDRGNLKAVYSMYAQKAASTYFQMTDRLLRLYRDAAGLDLLRQLEASV